MRARLVSAVFVVVSMVTLVGCAGVNPSVNDPTPGTATMEVVGQPSAEDPHAVVEQQTRAKLKQLEAAPTPEAAYAYKFEPDADVNLIRKQIREDFVVPPQVAGAPPMPQWIADGKPPTLPDEALINDEDGAINFILHYFDALVHAAVTGSVDYKRSLQSPACHGCVILNRRTIEDSKLGLWERMEAPQDFKYSKLEDKAGKELPFSYSFSFRIPSSSSLELNGKVDRATNEVAEFLIKVAWVKNAWFVTDFNSIGNE